MAQYSNSGRNRKARVGIVLVTVGTLLLLANLGVAVTGVLRFLASLGIEALGAPAAAALAILRFFQALAFHPAALLPFIYGILVSFFALAGILSGLMLLRNRNVENA